MLCLESSDEESVGDEEGGVGGSIENPLSGLQTKMKELNSSHDIAAKNRCICVYVFQFQLVIFVLPRVGIQTEAALLARLKHSINDLSLPPSLLSFFSPVFS